MVSVFAALGSCFQPKTFAGLFGSAPPIALVSLGIAYYAHGATHVETLSSSMLLGAIALLVYSACCLAFLRFERLPVWLGAALSWIAWGVVAAALLLAQESRAVAPRFSAQELRSTTIPQYLLRFVFGGLVAALAFAVSHAFGARVGGLFFAFPALLPAGLTLIKRHDGRPAARDDARGAMLGSLGMMAFAGVASYTCAGWGAAGSALALLSWVVVSVGAWWLVYGRKSGA